MINSLSTLAKQNEELRQEIELLKNSQSQESKLANCVCINKSFSNLEVILPKKIILSKLSFNQSSSLFFQGQINVFSTISEEVEFSLIINTVSIHKFKKTLNLGNNQINIFCNFNPILDENAVIFIKISPKNQKPIYLQDISLFVCGTVESQDKPYYQTICLKSEYLLSFLFNNNIYYKIVPNKEDEFCFNDFQNLEIASAYSFAYSNFTNKIYLFRVNLNGDLFYSVLNENEHYLMSKISAVSTIFCNNKILVFCISENKCLYFEIDENGNMFLVKSLKVNYLKLKNVFAYFNDKNNKVYIILTDINNSNFLMEQTLETFNFSDNLNARYEVSIETYEDL